MQTTYLMSDKQMWKDFFFDPITGVGDGIVLEDGSKIGLEFHMEDAAVLTASGGQLIHDHLARLPIPSNARLL